MDINVYYHKERENELAPKYHLNKHMQSIDAEI